MAHSAEAAPLERQTIFERYADHTKKEKGRIARALDALGLTAAAIGFMTFVSGAIGSESTKGVEHAYFVNTFNGGLIATAAGLAISTGVALYQGRKR